MCRIIKTTPTILAGAFLLPFPPWRWDLTNIRSKARARVTAAGARDPHAERDGIAGMKRAAAWLQAQSATVLDRIEDPDEGHGALQLNPQHARRVPDLFLDKKPECEPVRAARANVLTTDGHGLEHKFKVIDSSKLFGKLKTIEVKPPEFSAIGLCLY